MIYRLFTLLAVILSSLLSAQPDCKTFTREEMASQVINLTYSDRAGNFWIGTSNGLYAYNNEKWVYIGRIDNLETNSHEDLGNVLHIWEDGAGNIWVACRGKLFIFDGKMWVNYRDNIFTGYTVRYLLHDSRDDIWLCSEYIEEVNKDESIMTVPIIRGTVTRFNSAAWISYGIDAGGSYYVQRGEENQFYTGILEDLKGNIWIGSVIGLHHFNGINWKIYKNETLPSEHVTGILEDRHGNIWVGTTNGIGKFDGLNWEIFRRRDHLGGNCVRRMIQDREGRIWAFIYGNLTFQGISCYDGEKWEHFASGRELPAGNMISDLDDFSHSGMILTRFGAAKLDGKGCQILPYESGLTGDQFFAMTADTTGRLWICSDKGLFTGDGKSFRNVFKPDAGEWIITAMLRDSQGRIWVGTSDHEIFLVDNGEIYRYSVSDSLPEENVRVFVEDKSGRVWVIYRKELALFEF